MYEDFSTIEAQYERDIHLKREDVAKLEEWQRLQPHLPKPLHPIETALFLHSCYYNNEAAKRCIDTYYTYRTHCPEFFGKCNPFEQEVRLAMDICLAIVLPELTPDGYLVIYTRLLTDNPNVYDFSVVPKVCDIVTQLAIKQRGCLNGHIGILDLWGLSVKQLLKINLTSLKKAVNYMQNAQPIRLKSIHFVNGSKVIDHVLAMMRPFLNKELLRKTYVHSGDNATIFSFVPKVMLPIECGGSKFCAIDYYKNFTRRELEMHSDYFKLMQNQVVDESKRPAASKITGDLFGVDGTFKEIQFD